MLLLLALALAMRIHGIWWGVPDLATSPTDPGAPHYYSYHPDEWSILIPAVEQMNRRGDLNPQFFNYGTLYIYSVAAFIWLARVVGLVELTPGYLGFLYVLARLVAISCGVLTVWLTYLLGRRLYGRPVGFGAALLLAIMPLHVVHSHFAAVDVPVTFWITLSLLAATHLLAEGTRDEGRGTRDEGRGAFHVSRFTFRVPRALLWLLAASVAAGLAASTKYNGGLVFLPVLVATLLWWRDASGGVGSLAGWLVRGLGSFRSDVDLHLPANQQTSKPANLRQQTSKPANQQTSGSVGRLCAWIGGAALLAAAAFLLGTPYALLDFSHFWDHVQDELRHAHEARTLDFEGTLPGWVYYLLYGFPSGLGWMGTLAALVGLGVAGARRERGDVLLLTWCFLFYFVVGAAKDHFIRYLIPLLPALAVLTARWLWLVWSDGETLEARQPANPPTRQRFRLGRVVAGLVAVLVVLSCGIKSLAYLRLFDPPDARTEVAQWFRQTVPPGTRVGLSDWPWFYTPPLVPANGGSAPGARERFVRDAESGRYAWVWLRFQPEVLEQEKPEWVVLTDFEYGPRVRLGQATVLSFMQQLEKDYSLIRCLRRQPTFLGLTFDRGLVPHDWRYLNPEVRVYRIRLTSRFAAPSPGWTFRPAPGRRPPPRRSADRRRCVRAWPFQS